MANRGLDELLEVAKAASNQWLEQTYKTISQSYEDTLTDTFSSLRYDTDTSATDYSRKEYNKEHQRVGFQTQEEAERFASYVYAKTGEKAVSLNYAINGQYLVELPVRMNVEDEQATRAAQERLLQEQRAKQQSEQEFRDVSAQKQRQEEEERRKEEERQQNQQNQQDQPQNDGQSYDGANELDVQQFEAPVVYRQMSSTELINNYEKETQSFVTTVLPNSYELDREISRDLGSKDPKGTAKHAYVGAILSELQDEGEGFGPAAQKVQRGFNFVLATAKEYGAEDVGDALFKRDVSYRKPDGQEAQITVPSISSGFKGVKATVLHNDLVIVNGHVVEGELRNRILAQHRARIGASESIIQRHNAMEQAKADNWEEFKELHKENFRIEEEQRRAHFEVRQDHLEREAARKNAQRVKEGKEPIPFERAQFKPREYKEPVPNNFSATETALLDLKDAGFRQQIYALRESGELLHNPNWVEQYFPEAVKSPDFNKKLNKVLTKEEKMVLNAQAIRNTIYGGSEYALETSDAQQFIKSTFADTATARLAEDYNKSIGILKYSRTFQIGADDKKLLSDALATLKKGGKKTAGAVTAVAVSDELLKKAQLTQAETNALEEVLNAGSIENIQLTTLRRMDLESALNKYHRVLSEPVRQKKELITKRQGRVNNEAYLIDRKVQLLRQKEAYRKQITEKIDEIDEKLNAPEELEPETRDALLEEKEKQENLLKSTEESFDKQIETVDNELKRLTDGADKADGDVQILDGIQETTDLEKLQEYKKHLEEHKEELSDKLKDLDKELPPEAVAAEELSEKIKLNEAERGSAEEARKDMEALQRFYAGTTLIAKVPLEFAEVEAVKSILDRGHFSMSKDDMAILSGMLTGTAQLSNPERIRVLQMFHDYQAAEIKAINEIQDAYEGRAFDSENPVTAEEWAELNNRRTRFEKDRQAMNEMEGKLEPNEDTKNLREVKFGLEALLESGEFTVESLLMLNEDFIRKAEGLGMQFVKENGQFDMDMLDNIKIGSDAANALGLTERTKEALKTLNSENGYLRLVEDFGLGLVSVSTLTSMATKGVGKVDEELGNIAGTAVSGYHKAKYAKAVATRGFQVRNKFIEEKKLKKIGRKKPKKTPAKPAKPPAPPAPKPTRPVSKVANDKYLAKQAKIQAIRNKLDGTALGQLSKAIQGAKASFAQSEVGTALSAASNAAAGIAATAIAVVAVALGIFIGLLLIIVALICIIGSFAEGEVNPLAPMGYQDTAAYQLYDLLYQSEKEWLEKDIADFDVSFSNRKDLKYGYGFLDYDNYLGGNDSRFKNILYEDNNKLYINPFGYLGDADKVTNPTGDELANEITKYTGDNMIKVTSNANVYNQAELVTLDDDEGNTGIKADYVAADNGHTSNIKDILAMVDVMYDASINDMDDETLRNNFLGDSIAEFQWNEFKDFFVFKWVRGIGYNIAAWFNRVIFKNDAAEEKYLELIEKDKNGRAISYKTIQNYAMNLFEASHQQTLALDVTFHDQSGCNNSQTTKFPIKFFDFSSDTSKHIAPYITYENDGGDSVPIDLSKGDEEGLPFSVRQDDAVSDETFCVQLPWTANEETFNDYIKDSDCWTAETTTHERDSRNVKVYAGCKFIDSNTMVDGIWGWSQGNVSSYVNDSEVNGYASYKPYVMKKMISAFDNEKSKYSGYTTYSYDAATDTFTVTEYTVNDRPSNGWSHYYNSEVNGGGDAENIWSDDSKYSLVGDAKTIEINNDEGWSSGHRWWNYAFNYYMYTKHTTKYTHTCAGHEFTHCGGHVSAQSIGLVYSITNEQIAMAGIDDEPPVALGFDLQEHGYDSIHGKFNSAEANWSNAEAASKSGLPEYVTKDPQGSMLLRRNGGYGLNIMVDGEGDASTWADSIKANVTKEDGTKEEHTFKGLYPLQPTGMNKYARDIFELDSLILKGSNILATNNYKNYAAWDDGNMQMAVSKFSNEWQDVYGFNFPTEIADGCFELSERDVRFIPYFQSDDDKADHGDEIIKKALSWVGNGHFEDNGNEKFDGQNMSTHDHYFLDKSCGRWEADGTEYTNRFGVSHHISCATGDDLAFVNFISESFGDGIIEDRATEEPTGGDTASLQAGNIVRAEYRNDDGTLNRNEYYVYVGKMGSSHTDDKGNEHTLATVNEDGSDDKLTLNAMYRDGDELKRVEIPVGTKLYVRMQMDGGSTADYKKKIGTVYLIQDPDFSGATLHRYVINVTED